MKTEAEAKLHWCPFVRFSHDMDDNNATNRHDGGEHVPTYARCFGSACMSWRWGEPPLPLASDDLRPQPVPSAAPPPPTRADAARNIHGQQRRGFCGLAGKPEAL